MHIANVRKRRNIYAHARKRNEQLKELLRQLPSKELVVELDVKEMANGMIAVRCNDRTVLYTTDEEGFVVPLATI